jgi:hypothetical protein
MPNWLLSLILAVGKPALIAFLKSIERKFPGITDFVEAILRYLQGAENKAEAVQQLHSRCRGAFCPSELKGDS